MDARPTRGFEFVRGLAAGASCGAAAACVLTLTHFIGLRCGWQLALPEMLLLKLLGAAPSLTFRPAFFLFARKGYLYLLPLLLVLFLRRARPLVLGALGTATWLFAALVAAMACAMAYALDHPAGLLPGLVGFPIAGLLAAWRRWRISSTIVLSGGFALGTLLAQAFYAFPFQDDFPQLLSPLWGFIPPVALALVLVLGLSLLGTPPYGRGPHPEVAAAVADENQQTRQRVSDLAAPWPDGWRLRAVRLWGMTACCLACIVVIRAELRGVQVRESEPAGSHFLDDWAYDIYVTGEPPQLVWTDRRHIHVLTNPYGETHERYTVDDDQAYYVERIWASPTGGFYIQGNNKFEWWNAPVAGERLSYRPAARYVLSDWLRRDSSSIWTVAEDPVRRRLFTASEYFSRYAVIERDGGALIAQGAFSSATWPFWHFTENPAGRVLYATSALDDGGLYEVNLDSLAVERKASDLYLYETVLDANDNLLWGVRPLTGEVVAVDTRTYEMRYRIPVQFGLRDLQRDPNSGDLYTCSEIFGDIFRIDGRTRTTSRIGWCGRLCRDMFLDSQRHILWVATRDGICRIPTAGWEHASTVGR